MCSCFHRQVFISYFYFKNICFHNSLQIFSLSPLRPKFLLKCLLLWRHFHAPKRDAERTVIGCLTCRSHGLMGGPWPMKAAMDSRPMAEGLAMRDYLPNIEII